MSDQSMMPEPCDHHWIHYGQPSHSPIRWIVKCSQCNQFRIEDLQEQVDSIEAAAEQRGEIKALRDVEASLINWDVLRGDEQGTAEDHESIRIAAWIGRRADQIANKENE